MEYLESNLKVFTAKSDCADSTVMPAVFTWIAESLNEIAEVKSHEDHAVCAWLCLPTCGILSAQKSDFFVTFISNFLAAHRRNGLVLLVHPNRAAQLSGGRTGL